MTDNPEQTERSCTSEDTPTGTRKLLKQRTQTFPELCMSPCCWWCHRGFLGFFFSNHKVSLEKGGREGLGGHYSAFAFCWWIESTSSSCTTPPPLSPPPAGMSPCRRTLLLNTNQIWTEFSFSCFNFPLSPLPLLITFSLSVRVCFCV